jgi:uncharacterized membrane protein
MVLGDFTFLDAIWTMFIFFAWVMFVWLVFMLLWDNFRRSDHSGWAKAGWTIFILFLPLLGALIYMIVRPKMTEQDRVLAAQTQAYYAGGGVSTAEELAKLSELKAQGAITDAEYETLKARTIAGS